MPGSTIANGIENANGRLVNAAGRAPVLIVCEHASNDLPAEYGDLGLPAEALVSHIAWDPGALAVAGLLSAALDAPLYHARISRLVYDCNRPPEAPDSIPVRSEVWQVPGNAGLDAAARDARVAAVYEPFRAGLADIVATMAVPAMLVTIHSFTPVYHGRRRAVEIGILHDADSRLADLLLADLPARARFNVRRNEPYGPEHGVTHTLCEHALPRGMANVMIEIRNDLIAEAAGQAELAALLTGALRHAAAAIGIELPERRAA